MNLLIDTHVLIWTLANPSYLSPRADALMVDRRNSVFVSAVSAYEIEFKRPRSPELSLLPADLLSAAEQVGFEWLALLPIHAAAAGRLPRAHGDPFDRFIAAQGLIENLTVVTVDPKIAAFGVPTYW